MNGSASAGTATLSQDERLFLKALIKNIQDEKIYLHAHAPLDPEEDDVIHHWARHWRYLMFIGGILAPGLGLRAIQYLDKDSLTGEEWTRRRYLCN